MDSFIGNVLSPLAVFGGFAMTVLAFNKAKIDRIKAERQMWQQPVMPQESSVLGELRELKQKISQMESTSHQFDISFDAALSRLEGRVERIETKAAAASAVTTDTAQSLRNGNH